MATGKLIGADDAAADGNGGANYLCLCKFTASATGIITEFRVKVGGSGNIKGGIYSDAGGEPDVLLNSFGSTAVTNGWNTISIAATSVTSGTNYWLAFVSDAAINSYKAGSIPRRYKSFTYSGSLPNPAGSGYTSDTYIHFYAGWGILVLNPSSISQPVGYGSPKLNLSIKPSSILQALAYGTPAVSISGIIISPQGIAVIISYGTPTLKYPQTLSPLSIISLVSYGIPSVGIFGFIKPQSISQPVAIGTPTILKYVWHVILDGRYATETPDINRAYIIGRDQYGNPVYGTAVNIDEIALIGERLDFQPDTAIPSTAQAGDVASAVLSKMRLMRNKGVIVIPPNCGQELFDVVQISDSGANQSAVKFRVNGIRFEYNPREARYQQKLILGAT